MPQAPNSAQRSALFAALGASRSRGSIVCVIMSGWQASAYAIAVRPERERERGCVVARFCRLPASYNIYHSIAYLYMHCTPYTPYACMHTKHSGCGMCKVMLYICNEFHCLLLTLACWKIVFQQMCTCIFFHYQFSVYVWGILCLSG